MGRTFNVIYLTVAMCLAISPGVEAQSDWVAISEFPHYANEIDACDGYVPCDDCAPRTCGVRWNATADALFLHRSDPSSGVLVFNTDSPNEQLRADDFDFGFQTGVDVTLSGTFKNHLGIQLRYFGIDDWDDSQIISTTFDDLLQFNASPPVFVVAGGAIASNYASRLHNAEVNVTHEVCDWLGLLAGFRYAELNEAGVTSVVDATVPFAHAVATSNHLYGGQLGVETWLWSWSRLKVDASGKAGVYGNHSQQNSLAATPAATVFARSSDDRVAFLGEVAMTGTVCLTKCASVRGGYRLLWVDNVALASDQLTVTNFNDGAGYDGSGDVFYHGAFVGIELCH